MLLNNLWLFFENMSSVSNGGYILIDRIMNLLSISIFTRLNFTHLTCLKATYLTTQKMRNLNRKPQLDKDLCEPNPPP